MRTITPAVCTRPYFSRVHRIHEKYGAGDEARLHNDVSIENNNYGCIIMQNNGAMKLVNFTCTNSCNQAFFPPPMNAGYEASRLHH